MVVEHALVLAQFVPYHNRNYGCNDEHLASADREHSDKTPQCPRCWLLRIARTKYNQEIDVTLKFDWSPVDMRPFDEDEDRFR